MIDTDALHSDGVADDGKDRKDRNGRDFTAFYHAQFPAQLRRAAVLARSADEAADAVQQAFVDVYRRWSDLADPDRYLSRAVTAGVSTSVVTSVVTSSTTTTTTTDG